MLTFAKPPRYRYNAGFLYIELLRKRKDRWVEKPYKKGHMYDYCDIAAQSRIKPVDNSRWRPWHDKFSMYSSLHDFPFVPDTYAISNGRWIHNRRPSNFDKTYFVKHYQDDGARDTNVVKTIEEAEAHSKKKPKAMYIVQPAIRNLMLYNKRKFDLRVWVALVSDGITQVVRFYRYGRIRASFYEFDPDSDKRGVQLTNHSVNKHLTKEDTMFEFDPKYQHYAIMFHRMIPCIQAVLDRTALRLINPKINKLCWVTGWDFIFDQFMRPYLIEINHGPGCLKTKYMVGFYDAVISSIFEPMGNGKSISKHPDFVDLYPRNQGPIQYSQ